MNDIELLELAKKALNAFIAEEKSVLKIGEKFRLMNFSDYSVKARASASDRLTIACFARDKARDYLHKTLVDAGLCKPMDRLAYETRLLCHSHGFGHSVKFKYTPPLPKCYE